MFRQPCASAAGEFGQRQTCGVECIGRQNAWSSGVGDDRDATTRWERLGVEAGGDVEHLVQRVGANHAGLMKQRVDGDIARGQRGRVAARRPRSGARSS
jgi:hypothetical protein